MAFGSRPRTLVAQDGGTGGWEVWQHPPETITVDGMVVPVGVGHGPTVTAPELVAAVIEQRFGRDLAASG